jgi:hypothetical protein
VAADSLLRPGDNGSAVARAERVAFLVNAEAYFKAFFQAALRAQRSITAAVGAPAAPRVIARAARQAGERFPTAGTASSRQDHSA